MYGTSEKAIKTVIYLYTYLRIHLLTHTPTHSSIHSSIHLFHLSRIIVDT